MDKITSIAGALMADESGVTAIEYGLMAALIAVTIIGAVGLTSESLVNMYEFWSTAVRTAIAGVL